MEGWRLPGAPRHGIGFGGSSAAANPFLSSADLQPDDSWFGDPLASPSPSSKFVTRKRGAPATETTEHRPFARRRGEDSSARLSNEASMCGEPCHPASSSSVPVSTQQVPSAALQAGRLSLAELMPDLDVAPLGVEETVATEVQRILSIGKKDYRRVLDLQPSEWQDLQIVQSKYRRLMRLLHPDKRRKADEIRAGGKDRCDNAVSLIQEALSAAKREAQPVEAPPDPPDPQSDLKERMRQMQETQRRQARMSMQRQTMREEPAPLNVESLLSDISQVLGETAAPRSDLSASTPSNPNTTAELINLLAGLR